MEVTANTGLTVHSIGRGGTAAMVDCLPCEREVVGLIPDRVIPKTL